MAKGASILFVPASGNYISPFYNKSPGSSEVGICPELENLSDHRPCACCRSPHVIVVEWKGYCVYHLGSGIGRAVLRGWPIRDVRVMVNQMFCDGGSEIRGKPRYHLGSVIMRLGGTIPLAGGQARPRRQVCEELVIDKG